jgi:hypothetical protein
MYCQTAKYKRGDGYLVLMNKCRNDLTQEFENEKKSIANLMNSVSEDKISIEEKKLNFDQWLNTQRSELKCKQDECAKEYKRRTDELFEQCVIVNKKEGEVKSLRMNLINNNEAINRRLSDINTMTLEVEQKLNDVEVARVALLKDKTDFEDIRKSDTVVSELLEKKKKLDEYGACVGDMNVMFKCIVSGVEVDVGECVQKYFQYGPISGEYHNTLVQTLNDFIALRKKVHDANEEGMKLLEEKMELIKTRHNENVEASSLVEKLTVSIRQENEDLQHRKNEVEELRMKVDVDIRKQEIEAKKQEIEAKKQEIGEKNLKNAIANYKHMVEHANSDVKRFTDLRAEVIELIAKVRHQHETTMTDEQNIERLEAVFNDVLNHNYDVSYILHILKQMHYEMIFVRDLMVSNKKRSLELDEETVVVKRLKSEFNDFNLCGVCNERNCNMVFECGHRVCDKCIPGLGSNGNKCHMCRTTLTTWHKIY